MISTIWLRNPIVVLVCDTSGLVGRSFPTYAVVKRRRLQRSCAGRVVKPVIDMAVLGQVQSSTASMSDVWKLAATGELFAGVKLGFQPLPSNNF